MKKPKELSYKTVEMYVNMIRREGVQVIWNKKIIFLPKLLKDYDVITAERLNELVYRNGFKMKLNIQLSLF